MLEFVSQLLCRFISQLSISIFRSVLEYACLVWHPGLSKTQANEIERVQKRCLRIIYPEHTYTEALLISGLDTLQSRREINSWLVINFGKLKTKIIFFTHFYPNEKPHLWLSETRILIKSKLPKFQDMDEGLYHIVFQKDFKHLSNLLLQGLSLIFLR